MSIEKTYSRPNSGTILAILYSIGFALLMLINIFFFFLLIYLFLGLAGFNLFSLGGSILFFILFSLIFFYLPFNILMFFLVKGLWKGDRWTLYFVIGESLLLIVSLFIKEHFDLIKIASQHYVYLLFQILLIILAFLALQDPFYRKNTKKIKKKKSE